MSLQIFPINDLRKAIEQNGNNTITITQKKGPSTTGGPVEYLNLRFNLLTHIGVEGWFTFENVKIAIGPCDPTDKSDPRSVNIKNDMNRRTISTTISMSGEFGKTMLMLHKIWLAAAEKIREDKQYENLDLQRKGIHPIVQTNYSKKHKTKSGAPIEDPYINLKLDFGTFSSKYYHKFLAGLPKTQLFDADTRRVEKGREIYDPLTYVNDLGVSEPVNISNVHKVLTRGTEIVKGRIMLPSIAISQAWISIPTTAVNLYVRKNKAEGFSDEFVHDPDYEELEAAIGLARAPAEPEGIVTIMTTDAAAKTTTTSAVSTVDNDKLDM